MTIALVLPDWVTAANATALAGLVVLAAGCWVVRRRDLARQRVETHALRSLGEEIFAARSAAELHECLLDTLQAQFEVGSVTIYVHNRAGHSLHALAPAGTEPAVVPLDSERPAEGLRLAFRQQESLLLEDPRAFPCPVLWLPMRAEGETRGVLECRFAAFGRRPDDDARLWLQHVANQLAVAVELLEQRQMREDALRGERLVAALELVSGVAAEVRASLGRIQNQSGEILRLSQDDEPKALAQQLHNDAAYARSVLERLVSFGKGASAAPSQFDWNALVRSLIAFRSDAWRLLILEPDVGLCPQQLPVFGVRGQLEQALLGLLVHAEQSLRGSGARMLRLTTAMQGGSATLSLEFAATAAAARTEGAGGNQGMGLSVIRGIVESQGGTVSESTSAGQTHIDLRLPLSGPAVPHAAAAEPAAAARQSLTLLVSVAHEDDRRRAVELAAQCGHRAIPAGSAAEALELLARLRFDAVLASSALPDMAWNDLEERVRGAGVGFVLLDASQTVAPPDLPLVHAPFEAVELQAQLSRLAG